MKEGLKKALMPVFPDLRVYEIIKFVEQSSRLINVKANSEVSPTNVGQSK